jgi:hypothetical protein
MTSARFQLSAGGAWAICLRAERPPDEAALLAGPIWVDAAEARSKRRNAIDQAHYSRLVLQRIDHHLGQA